MSNLLRVFVVLALACLSLDALGQSGVLHVDIGSSRSRDTAMEIADAAVRRFAKNLAALTLQPRSQLSKVGRWHDSVPFSPPAVVRLMRNGQALPGPAASGRGPGITLEFDTSGARAFPPTYKQLLEDTFNRAQSTITAVFGEPSLSGTVHVRNYDADIQDRYAVSGGYYVNDNGGGEREIRFPVYNNGEAASVNFLHCLLLAYLGPKAYTYDGFQEGLVRAATMRVARTAGAMPIGLDAGLIEQVLDNTYDVGAWYDWYNQRALGGPRFIAPNLIDPQLPPGGSIGGIYLLRYKMSGSAWQKVITEYPGFIALFNQGFYADTSIANNPAALAALGQSVIDTLRGSAGATVEGYSFSQWAWRQFILDPGLSLGRKLLVECVPFPPVGGSNDFGVFLVQATWFETLAGGNETLLSGVSYPIFWTDAFDRLFPSAQEDRMDIAGAYGSVVPNLPDLHLGVPYRVSVDIPVQDRIARTYVPAGAVATGTNVVENDFYGTVCGVSGTLRVRLTMGQTVIDNIPITFGAFGTRINTQQFLGYQRVRVEVVQNTGNSDVVVIDRLVNKGPGPLALDLRPNNGDAVFALPNGLPKGMSTVGFALDPHDTLLGAIFGIPENQVLAARWNGSKARYDIYPDGGGAAIGNGIFTRIETAQPNFALVGRAAASTPIAVALRPGWNLIANPLTELVPTSRVTVVHSTDFPKTFAESLGVELGADFFEFTPGAPDAATGAPETGTMTAATQFQPGKAYFVRVLSAEGVTLLFTPQNALGPQNGRAAEGGLRILGAGQGQNSEGWTLKFGVLQGPYKTEAYIGQTRSATFGFDPAEDSGLPPGMGGMQVEAAGSEVQYRDIRPLFAWTNYRLNVKGLTPGKTYTVKLTFAKGSLRRYEFWDIEGRYKRNIQGELAYTFRASESERPFQIRVQAGSF